MTYRADYRIGNAVESLVNRPYNQGLFEASATQRHRLGLIRPLEDGRVFAYAQAGAAQLAAGILTQRPVVVANHKNCALTAACDTVPIGAKEVGPITIGATALTANQYKDGWLVTQDGTGEGYAYKVRGHAAFDASATTVKILLYDAVRVAIPAGAEVTLAYSQFAAQIIHPSPPTNLLGGVTPLVVPATYYYWSQVSGVAPILINGTVVVGNIVTASLTVDGAVEAFALTEGTPNTGAGQYTVGYVADIGATGETGLICIRDII